MVNIIKKIMLAALFTFATLFAIIIPAFAQVPENSTIEVTIDNVSSIAVFDNTTDITEFVLNLTNQTEIISDLADKLNITIEEVEAIITFQNATIIEPPSNLADTSIDVLIHVIQNNSDVTIFENDTQTDNFILNLTNESEIIDALALIYNVTIEEVQDVTTFQIDNGNTTNTTNTTNTLENYQIRVLINENLNITEVTVFENSVQIDSFVLNTTVPQEIINGISLRLNANKNDVLNVIVNEIIVDTTLGEWTLFVFFDNYLNLYNIVEDNVNGVNPFPANTDLNSGRIITQSNNFSDMNSPVQVAVDSDRWLMFKFFKAFANSDNGLMLLLNNKE